MLRNILVPLDGSKLSEQALSLATALSVPTSARLLLLRTATARDEAQRYLRDVAAGLVERGFVVETHAPDDEHPAEAILREAMMYRADLIVMTTHGRTGPGRWISGSVAEAVVARSRLPVMLQRAWDPGRRAMLLGERPRLLVTLDGSRFAEAALPVAAGLADDLGAELVLLGVETTPHDVLIAEEDIATQLDAQEAGHPTNLQDYLVDCSQRVAERLPDLALATLVEVGDPAARIVAAAAEAEAALVVMATHGRSGLARTAFGSVAGRVLAQGQAPLVLVHPHASGQSARVANHTTRSPT
jgi:nucleotide-binding universal stress UspA family protein